MLFPQPGQLSRTRQRDIHTIECHAQYINWGELAGRGGSLLGHRSAGGEQLHCASLVFSWVLFLSFFFCYIPFHYNYYIIIIIILN